MAVPSGVANGIEFSSVGAVRVRFTVEVKTGPELVYDSAACITSPFCLKNSDFPSVLNFGSSLRVWPVLLVRLIGMLVEPTCQKNTFHALLVMPMKAIHLPSGLNTAFIGSWMPQAAFDTCCSVRAEKS